MGIWCGPIYKILAKSELGAGHTSGVVPTKNTQSFFGTPNEKKSHLVKKITIEFFDGTQTKIIQSNLMYYYKKGTHNHFHISGGIMPEYIKAGATSGDVILFWKSNIDETQFKAELIKKNSDKWNMISDQLTSPGGIFKYSEIIAIDEEEYQKEVFLDEALTKENFPAVKKPKQSVRAVIKKTPYRSKAKGNFVLKEKKYLCELDHEHITFMTPSNTPYMEKHHLIPMEFYEEFDVYIDDVSNIMCICPNCHRKFHQGAKSEVVDILKKSWLSKKEELADKGIIISFEELVNYYF